MNAIHNVVCPCVECRLKRELETVRLEVKNERDRYWIRYMRANGLSPFAGFPMDPTAGR